MRSATYESEATWISSADYSVPLTQGLDREWSVLDVCSGPAVLARSLADGIACVSVDVSVEMLRRARVGLTVVAADAAALPFKDDSFDVVLCRQGAHYISDLPAFLSNLRRVARREVRIGNVVMWGSTDRPFWEAYARLVTPSRHQYFEQGAIGRLLDESGFSDISREYRTDRTGVASSLISVPLSTWSEVYDIFRMQPPAIASAYEIEVLADDSDIHYSVLWEFTKARV